MGNLTKVVYKPSTQSTEEYAVIVKPEEYNKWKAGDNTIPLAEVVDSFQVFHSTQGNQGILGQASNQQLENTFGTSKDIDVVLKVLEGGKAHSGTISERTFQTNATKGSAVIDSRGKGLTGI